MHSKIWVLIIGISLSAIYASGVPVSSDLGENSDLQNSNADFEDLVNFGTENELSKRNVPADEENEEGDDETDISRERRGDKLDELEKMLTVLQKDDETDDDDDDNEDRKRRDLNAKGEYDDSDDGDDDFSHEIEVRQADGDDDDYDDFSLERETRDIDDDDDDDFSLERETRDIDDDDDDDFSLERETRDLDDDDDDDFNIDRETRETSTEDDDEDDDDIAVIRARRDDEDIDDDDDDDDDLKKRDSFDMATDGQVDSAKEGMFHLRSRRSVTNATNTTHAAGAKPSTACKSARAVNDDTDLFNDDDDEDEDDDDDDLDRLRRELEADDEVDEDDDDFEFEDRERRNIEADDDGDDEDDFDDRERRDIEDEFDEDDDDDDLNEGKEFSRERRSIDAESDGDEDDDDIDDVMKRSINAEDDDDDDVDSDELDLEDNSYRNKREEDDDSDRNKRKEDDDDDDDDIDYLDENTDMIKRDTESEADDDDGDDEVKSDFETLEADKEKRETDQNKIDDSKSTESQEKIAGHMNNTSKITPAVTQINITERFDFKIAESGKETEISVNSNNNTTDNDKAKGNRQVTENIATNKNITPVVSPYETTTMPVPQRTKDNTHMFTKHKKTAPEDLNTKGSNAKATVVTYISGALSGRAPVYKPMGGEPTGPIAEKEHLDKEYGPLFSTNPKVDVEWMEPHIYNNCWVTAMLSRENGFSPNCNNDGTYAPKQCFLQRCWCVNKDGTAKEVDTNRFHYKIDGAMLRCTQHY